MLLLPRTFTAFHHSLPSYLSHLPTRLLSTSLSAFPFPPKPPSPPSPITPLTTIPTTPYTTIIIGGGHAGTEASLAASTIAASTIAASRNHKGLASRALLVTLRADTVGELSCNPSIGGVGKGHLVREIDAMGGVIGKAADDACVHFRTLNDSKGMAVRGPRGQMDRDLYKATIQSKVEEAVSLDVVEGEVDDLVLKDGVCVGVKLQDGRVVYGNTTVITTGTFLGGVLLCGRERYAGGRHLRDSEEVEPPSNGLSKTLKRFEFELGRLKTGTPARIDGRTIDYSKCAIQGSEDSPKGFSHTRQYMNHPLPQLENFVHCHQTATNSRTHEICLEYEHMLPEYDGDEGDGVGPRYCPSIFKKVQRFPERERHNTFLEPEGINTDTVYPNGMSGPYPPDVQLKILRSMEGLENVEIIRPGYDVEYDFVNPNQLKHTLETKKIPNLFLAGQICGTTGYEEAAAQGIVAGANAAAKAVGREEEFLVGRDEGYVGVLIDDLVTKGTSEPYRMFTSRSEYRLTLRADNADVRLTRKAMEYGLLEANSLEVEALEARVAAINFAVDQLREFTLFVAEWAEAGGEVFGGKFGTNSKKVSGNKKTAEEVLRMPHVNLDMVEKVMKEKGGDGFVETPVFARDTVEASVKYSSYLARQDKDMESWRMSQNLPIPVNIAYDRAAFPTLKQEELEKLQSLRPSTFKEANLIPGMTPQSLVVLYHHVTRRGGGEGRGEGKRAEVLRRKEIRKGLEV